jgi:single-strand DNA-binding protein
MGINKVILVGNVGRDVDFRATQGGTSIAKFSLATTDRRFKDENGNPRTEWHNIVAWGKLAEICERYVTKGKQLYIEGQIRTRTYEQDGQKKYFTEIHAEQMEMLSSGSPGGGGGPRDESREDYGAVAQSFPDDADDVPF